ncbi:MAG TPA: xanthomonadin biosynthesis protein [Rhodanobacteraceae bacterium]|nr:xanthomonadin biosynthesis protein [Rhodanobacteraceae bacterium]
MLSPLRRRTAVSLLLAYPPLGLVGALLRLPPLSVAALVCLLLALGLLMLQRRQPLASALWLLIALPAAGAMASQHAELALAAVPLLGNALLAGLFAHTLRHGREPLVARFICMVEGPGRLALPGVRRYARQVTLFWALLLGAQAAWLALLWLCMVPDGALATLGLDPPWPLAQAGIAWYVHAGAWLVPLAGMVGEYLWRRWRLRHIPHLGARRFAAQLIACWPRLLHDAGRAP